MSIEKEMIKIDYTNTTVPESAKNFRPEVYKDEHGFYVVLGTDPTDRIIGQGDTLAKAFEAWDVIYQQKQRH